MIPPFAPFQPLSLFLVKPNGVPKAGAMLQAIADQGFSFVDLAIVPANEARIRVHYKVHEGKPFYDNLFRLMMSGESWAAIVSGGDDVVQRLRDFNGNAVLPAEGTLRNMFRTPCGNQPTHTSDALETAGEEISLWFPGRMPYSFSQITYGQLFMEAASMREHASDGWTVEYDRMDQAGMGGSKHVYVVKHTDGRWALVQFHIETALPSQPISGVTLTAEQPEPHLRIEPGELPFGYAWNGYIQLGMLHYYQRQLATSPDPS